MDHRLDIPCQGKGVHLNKMVYKEKFAETLRKDRLEFLRGHGSHLQDVQDRNQFMGLHLRCHQANHFWPSCSDERKHGKGIASRRKARRWRSNARSGTDGVQSVSIFAKSKQSKQ